MLINNLTNSTSFGRSRRDTLKSIFLRDFSQNEQEESHANNDDESKKRAKRQSPGREALCQVSSQFVTPQAALNSRGK